MAEYGLRVNGAPPTDGMAMLVDVVQTPTDLAAPEGRYLFPTLTDKQKERFFHYFSDWRRGKGCGCRGTSYFFSGCVSRRPSNPDEPSG